MEESSDRSRHPPPSFFFPWLSFFLFQHQKKTYSCTTDGAEEGVLPPPSFQTRFSRSAKKHAVRVLVAGTQVPFPFPRQSFLPLHPLETGKVGRIVKRKLVAVQAAPPSSFFFFGGRKTKKKEE